jgi:cytochrome d ubiquinol oxidase subunit I
MWLFDAAQTLGSSDLPPGLLPSRQQMAVSLGWHTILACFGVAFPTMFYVVHRRGIMREDLVGLPIVADSNRGVDPLVSAPSPRH